MINAGELTWVMRGGVERETAAYPFIRHSSVLRKMLEGPWKEGATLRVELPNRIAEHFDVFAREIDKITDEFIGWKDAQVLAEWADYYDVPELRRRADICLATQVITPENVAFFFRLASKFGLERTKAKCLCVARKAPQAMFLYSDPDSEDIEYRFTNLELAEDKDMFTIYTRLAGLEGYDIPYVPTWTEAVVLEKALKAENMLKDAQAMLSKTENMWRDAQAMLSGSQRTILKRKHAP